MNEYVKPYPPWKEGVRLFPIRLARTFNAHENAPHFQ